MKRLWFLFGLSVCLLASHAIAEEAPKETGKAQYHAEPQTALETLTTAFNQSDLSWMSGYVEGAPKDTKEHNRLSETWRHTQGRWTLGIRNPQITIQGDEATAKIETVLTHAFLAVEFRGTEEILLHRRKTEWGSEWIAAPRKNADFIIKPGQKPVGALQRAIDMAAYPAQALVAATTQVTQQNIKLLSLGIMQFVQDYNERYDNISNDNFKERIKPYVQDEAIFRAPGLDNEVGYFFNPSLSNKPLAELEEPAQTVMLFESIDGQLNFRHDGRAAVGFADGHVKLITREEAKTLRWKP